MTSDWERGFAAGYNAAVATQAKTFDERFMPKAARKKSKPKRKASAYSKRYGAAFKRLSKKYKTKSGSWRKGGFKACQKAAHKAAKK